MTWWIWPLIIGLGVASGVALDRFLLRPTLRRGVHLEETVRERTQEVQSKQDMLERQNKRLEVNNTILKFVNARIGFSDLLQTILEGILFLQSSDRALALTRDDDNRFPIRAACGWRFGEPQDLVLERAEIEEAYLVKARQVAPGIWTGPPAPSRLLDEEQRLGGEAKAILVMRIEVESDVAGYLIIHHVRDEDAFDHEDLEALEDLKQHMASAFLKGHMMEQLRELNEKKNEFLGMAAHDLRNPLTGVIGFTEILLHFLSEDRLSEDRLSEDRLSEDRLSEDRLSEDRLGEDHLDKELWSRFLKNIRILSEDMCTMVNQLLDVSAIEAGKVALQIEQRRLDTFLDERGELHAQTAREKGIELEFDTDLADAEVLMDRVRIGEVVDNLVSNAIKFTWPGGRVRVFCEAQNGEIVTHVEDNGQGLEPHELADVSSGKKLSARPTAGESSTGLGLVIVKKIVELHAGKTWIDSRKGQGSKFSFSLPRPSTGHPSVDRPSVDG